MNFLLFEKSLTILLLSFSHWTIILIVIQVLSQFFIIVYAHLYETELVAILLERTAK